MKRRTAVLAVVAASVLSACESKESGKRALEQLAELQKKKAAEAAARANAPKPGSAPIDTVKLDPPYNDDGSTRIVPETACPEGIWALFTGEAPGATDEEKSLNEAKRKELADSLTAKTFMVRMRAGNGVTLKPYDAAKGEFTIEVAGTIDCLDSRGRVAIAWSATKTQKSASAGELGQAMWVAAPVTFKLPMTSQTEAKTFENENRTSIAARVVFRPGKAEVHKLLRKVEKVEVVPVSGEKTVGYGGGMEDWGAGRLLHVELIGIRVGVKGDEQQLFDQRASLDDHVE